MTPFGSVFMLPIDLPFEKMVDEMKCTEYSRVPFYYNDRTNVVGVLHVRDLSKYYRKKRAGENVKIESVIRPPVFVTPNLPLERLLREFQRSHVHIAFVKNDEELIGIVTMDDVLEELFGEIEE
jgi:CBS domain containing-hemolysin-like protein